MSHDYAMAILRRCPIRATGGQHTLETEMFLCQRTRTGRVWTSLGQRDTYVAVEEPGPSLLGGLAAAAAGVPGAWREPATQPGSHGS